jgi:hypothetical protein
MQLEGTAHPGDGAHDWGIDLAEIQILDERLIDCDRVDGKPLEIREGRIARPKVIDRQSSF